MENKTYTKEELDQIIYSFNAIIVFTAESKNTKRSQKSRKMYANLVEDNRNRLLEKFGIEAK
jgi:hypothetical protein